MGQSNQEWTKSRPYPAKFFKGCLPQILLGPLFNTLFDMQTNQFLSPLKSSETLHQIFSFLIKIILPTNSLPR